MGGIVAGADDVIATLVKGGRNSGVPTLSTSLRGSALDSVSNLTAYVQTGCHHSQPSHGDCASNCGSDGWNWYMICGGECYCVSRGCNTCVEQPGVCSHQARFLRGEPCSS